MGFSARWPKTPRSMIYKVGFIPFFRNGQLAIHRCKELIIALCADQMLPDELHGLFRLHIGEVVAQDKHALESILVEQEVVTTGAGTGEVNRWVKATVRQAAVKLQFHISCTLKVFENGRSHLRRI